MDPLPSHSGRLPTSTTPAAAATADNSSWHRDPISIARTSSSSTVDSPSYGGSGSQSLASILNNPLASRSDASWSIWWPSASSALPEPPPPIVSSTPIPDYTRADFQTYLTLISDSFSKFEDVRNHTSKENADLEIRGQGEALVACLREVPSLFFKEDFALEEGETFRAACPFSPVGVENAVLQEKLTQYLDVVEMHLVKEISLRSESFFEAQGQLQGLNGEIVEACDRIRELKETIRILTVDLVDSARQVQELNATRGNLVALQQKLTVILYVSQALSTLKLLVASADCAGALDVIDDLQHVLDSEELAGLHCFRHLRDQVATSISSIHSILSAEFMNVARYGTKDMDSLIRLNYKERPDHVINGVDEMALENEESSIFQDHLLPLIIGLLRTAKLPSVLRMYRDALISDMKMSIKSTVAELLPVLVSRSLDTDSSTAERQMDADGGTLSLASKLRTLSSESFVQLLAAIFKVVQAHLVLAAEVKRVIEWIMGNLDGCDASDSVAAAVALGAAAAAAAESSQDGDVQLISSVAISLPRNAPKVSSFHGNANESASPNTAKNFRADVLRENTEAVFAACDAAHGRWAKLLGVRALLHPKLRLQEFLGIYNITQDFITATEKIGGRLGYSIRGTLQSQSKAFVDFQHDSRMTKIKAVLDQETWVVVDVPQEFQAIVDSLSSEARLELHNTIEPDKMGDTVAAFIDSSSPVVQSSLTSGDNVNSMEVTNSIRNGNRNAADHGKNTSQTIVFNGVGYHMVNCGLILLKMLSEYIDICRFLPSLSSEIVHRVVEFLKLFNTRTCQLVLGAGAMQVSGLKSITSKHLALASQIISFTYATIPDIRQVLFLKIPGSRKGLLLSEIDRVAQDYKVHRDEIHSKLVQIMRERLLANLRKLPQIVETWNSPEDNDPQPSQFARSVTKEVSYLHRILSQTLLENDIQAIFRQVVQIFHSHISDAYSNIEINTPQAKNRLCLDVQHILGCIRKLPSDIPNGDGVPNLGLLDELLAKKIGTKDDGS